MGTHPIFESDFDCLTEYFFGEMSKDDWHYSEQGPFCRPIKSLEELLFWDEHQIMSEKSTTDIIPVTPAPDGLVRKVKRGIKNKDIICHDMKGGYNEDIFPNGEDGLKIPDYIWENTSMFIYFSHNFITIPRLRRRIKTVFFASELSLLSGLKVNYDAAPFSEIMSSSSSRC